MDLPAPAARVSGPRGGGAEGGRELALALARARTGDPAACEALYRDYARAVHGIALARVGPGEAEDVTQEAFAAVFRGLSAVRDAAALPGWICAVARNVAEDARRRRARRPAPGPLASEPVAPPVRDGEGELRSRVLRRLEQLPQAYRETLVLRLVEGLSGPEIAARTGLSPGSVRVNLCRGMALLRPLLQEEGWP